MKSKAERAYYYLQRAEVFEERLKRSRDADERRRLVDVIEVYKHLAKCDKAHSLHVLRGDRVACHIYAPE